MAKLGITMIEMYVKMVRDEFAPLVSEIEMHESNLRDEVEIKVKKKLGVLKLYEEKAALTYRLGEINAKLDKYERHAHVDGYGRMTIIDRMVKDHMRMHSNGVSNTINTARDGAIKEIRLSGISGDIKKVFDSIPDIIAKLTKALPVPKKVKQLK